mmetsp:Transcript_4393/g.7492  ORF Transcript_4393/g.7492 Transcript_4393/m.7492 type:complete len:271 (-) Transcript_4393:741-1553(-)|eukprot:CAMPEP_0114413758 /NCGR_PEP_ID=MMETSP0103-20121206/1025_1 /TAXON_ID=37642 ORGANISM="Paraphysomonas imperforata, Strain PA2" /NCGR_SAMPLE_ID=MMETSP0103 /ASSEMBLY_ACC=CAM_ASM_000201 /LENGTH=270 /DNA_ID=CAMNT_0001581853 /DNA_START=131 /DNA_END=943 /DNA_ORIENTATION=+
MSSVCSFNMLKGSVSRWLGRRAGYGVQHCSRPSLRFMHHSPSLLQSLPQQEGDEGEEPSWQWVPPRARQAGGQAQGPALEEVVPLRKGEYLTVEEVTAVLQHFKGEDIVAVPIGPEKILDGIEHFILVSGDSTRHIRRMADAILKQVRGRKLLKAAAFKNGVEGDKVDDWLVVDCHNCVVHCMLPATRKSLDLESHWGAQNRPFAKHGGSDKDYEDSLDKLFNQHPPPPDAEPPHVGNRASRRGEHSSGAPTVTGTVMRFPPGNPSPHDY